MYLLLSTYTVYQYFLNPDVSDTIFFGMIWKHVTVDGAKTGEISEIPTELESNLGSDDPIAFSIA